MIDGDRTRPATALITGASGGIGLELARAFALHGHSLVLVARSAPKLERLAAELRRNADVAVTALPKDLSQPDAADALFEELQRAAVSVDVLVNNAGVLVYGIFTETDWAREAQMLQLNLVALTRLTKLFLPPMVQRNSGRILNVGSTGSFVPGPYSAVYSATKAYVLSFSEALAQELAGTGVTVTALCPGVTRTALQAGQHMEGIRLMRWGAMDARAVAEIGYRGLIAGRTVVVPGLHNTLQVFSARLLPRRAVASVAKRVMEPVKKPA